MNHRTDEIMPYDFSRLKYEMRPGDVLLIEGRSRMSNVIRTIHKAPGHMRRLYIGRLVDFEDDETERTIQSTFRWKDNTRLIIEDLMDRGTVITPLSSYRDHHIRICRRLASRPLTSSRD